MKGSRVVLFALLGVAVGAVPARSQDTDPFRKGEPTGIRESARLLDVPTVGIGRLAAGPAPVQALLIPAFAWADGLKIAGATGAYINRDLGRPIQLRLGYTKLDVAEGEDRDQIGVDAKGALVDTSAANRMNPLKLTVFGEFKRTVNTSRRVKGGASLEQTLQNLTLGATLEYIRAKPDDDESTDAAKASVGVSYAWPNAFETAFDYSFDNAIDGEDDYSLTVVSPLTKTGSHGPVSLIFGAGKHRLVFATIVVPFR